MKVYDRSMLDCIAKQFDMTVENLERVKAQKTNWWGDFCRFYKQFGAAAHTPNRQAEVTPLSIFYAEARVLRSLAEEEDCIIVGRAGFHIFRDHPNALHLLIRAKRDARIARIAQKQNLSLDEAAKGSIAKPKKTKRANQPNPTSRAIITTKPMAKQMVDIFVCSPFAVSGISSSTTT